MRLYVGEYDAKTKMPKVFIEVVDGNVTRQVPITPIGLETEPYGWGYNDKATANLAWAICMDALDGDVARVERVVKVYKHHLVTQSLEDGFSFSKNEVIGRILAIEEALADRQARPAAFPRGMAPF